MAHKKPLYTIDTNNITSGYCYVRKTNPRAFRRYELTPEDHTRAIKIHARFTKWVALTLPTLDNTTPEFKRAMRNRKYARKQLHELCTKYIDF